MLIMKNKENYKNKVKKKINSANNINRVSKHNYKNIEAKINNEIKIAKPRELIDATWKSKIDNSISILIFWLNFISIILNSCLNQVGRQSNKVNKDVKIIESSTKTLDIGNILSEELLQIKSIDDSMMKHQIDITNKNFDNVELKVKMYDKIDEIDFCNIIVKLELVFVEKIILFIAILMFIVIMRPNVNSYAGLGCDQKVCVINCHLVENINYREYIINNIEFKRNYKLNRDNNNFEDEVYRDLSPLYNKIIEISTNEYMENELNGIDFKCDISFEDFEDDPKKISNKIKNTIASQLSTFRYRCSQCQNLAKKPRKHKNVKNQRDQLSIQQFYCKSTIKIIINIEASYVSVHLKHSIFHKQPDRYRVKLEIQKNLHLSPSEIYKQLE
ncbi:6461_t:CDS:2 [Dentiscutata erythropus]|uniref:6461_t:CDS:1 n=1 Tax=Dentiscutata erythropus TaxID=1348616 RepID=A0A9N9BUW3_9GLOM|nr:6461_t:CDS:2 [Dentiscutata erythropus]